MTSREELIKAAARALAPWDGLAPNVHHDMAVAVLDALLPLIHEDVLRLLEDFYLAGEP